MLQVKNISKAFPGVQALDDVSIDFQGGELHGLLGENGAGKSTLVKIICGVYKQDKGQLFYNKKPLEVESVKDASSKGINMVMQELQVLNISSVAENIMIDKFDKFSKGGFINWRRIHKEAQQFLDFVELDVPPTALVGYLSPVQKKMVQIARALSSQSKILLLDEPTSSITDKEADILFGILNKLKEQGIVLIFVTHKLEEVFKYCEKASVLRDGKLIGTKPISELKQKEVIRMMIGREEKIESYSNENVNRSKKVLEVRNLSRENKVHDVSLDLYEGEVLGIYGLIGSGRTEFARLLIGEDKKDSGEVILNGKKIEIKSLSEAIYKYKMGYVTENRKEEGLFLMDNVRRNVNVVVWPEISGNLLKLIKNKAERDNVKKMIKELDIRVTNSEQIVGNLSGGNQQKVSIAKWLIAECEILIFDEPTIGIDVGAKKYIHKLIYNLANDYNKSIILISSDLPEVVTISNRIIVFNNKKVIGEVEEVPKIEDSYDQVSHQIGEFYLKKV